jgi:hypothetical protein
MSSVFTGLRQTFAIVSLCTLGASSAHCDNTATPLTDGAVSADAQGGDAMTVSVREIPGHEGLPVDRTHKEGPRVLPAEVYIRSYLQLFGGLTPIAAQAQGARDGLFDQWNDYIQSLGLPDHRIDLARNTQQTMLSAATIERLSIALCDRAVLRDFRGNDPPSARVVFAFATPASVEAVTPATFATQFDSLHRTFLGYPARLAPAARGARFYQLFQGAAQAQATARGAGATPSFTPVEAGYAAVCYALARHPEFVHY